MIDPLSRAVTPPPVADRTTDGAQHCLHWREIALVVGITALAACLRAILLGRLPPGLYRDEAYNGLDALDVLRGARPIFFEANNGREPLFIYLAALSVAAFGRTPWALRLVSAVLGTLTVPATYWVGATLFDKRVARIAMLLAATSVWMINLSRVAFRAVSLPLASAVMLALLWRALSHRRIWGMALAGVAWGLCFYTYLAARFTPLVVLILMAWSLLRDRRSFWRRGWSLFCLSAAAVVAPLAIYLFQHWDATMLRAGQVSVWNPSIGQGEPWRALWRNLGRTLLGFVWRGDFIPRHNVPLRPVFEPVMAAMFLIGLVIAVRRTNRGEWLVCLVWTGVMCLPTIMAEGAPHFLRMVGVLPVVLLFPATGLSWVCGQVAARLGRRAGWAVAVVVLAYSAVAGGISYWRHARGMAAYYQFETGAAQLAGDINRCVGTGWRMGEDPGDSACSTEAQVLLAGRLWETWPSVRFLVVETERLHLLSTDCAMPGEWQTGGDVSLFLWPYEDTTCALALLPAGARIAAREGAREQGDLETESRLLYVLLRATRYGDANHDVLACWRDDVCLLAASLQPTAKGVRVTTRWLATATPQRSWTLFRHVDCAGGVIGQLDGPLALGYYSTERWRTGDVVEDSALVPTQGAWQPGCRLSIGLYDWRTGERLLLVPGAVLGHDDSAVYLSGSTP